MACTGAEDIRCRIFISYAREDSDHLKEIKEFVKNDMFFRTEVIDDTGIPKGAAWFEFIKSNLATADIVLLILSQSFVNSKFIQTEELPKALDRHDSRKARVIPVLLKDYEVPVQDTKIKNRIDAIRETQGFFEKPILNMSEGEKNDTYVSLVRELRKAVKDLLRTKIEQKLSVDPSTQQIRRLKQRKIFVSLPGSEQGKYMRTGLLKHILREKINGSFKMDVVPDIEIGQELYNNIASCDGKIDSYKRLLGDYIEEAFCAIHIISEEADITDLDRAQIELSKNSGLLQIYWYCQAPATAGHRLVKGGKSYAEVVDEIRSLELLRESEHRRLTKPLFDKDILFLHTLECGGYVELATLSSRIKESPICNANLLALYSDEEEKIKKIDPKHIDGGLMFFSSSLDLDWLAPRQKDILLTSHRGVYVSEPIGNKQADIDKLMMIMDKNDTLIQGEAEISDRVDEFLICLCLNQLYARGQKPI